MPASSDGSGSLAAAASALLVVSVLLTGCAGQQREQVLSAAAAAGFSREAIAAGRFEITALARAGAAPLIVYIEGDGYAWRSRRLPSRDPTPRDPLALRLALADPSPAVVYLARPCQYARHAAACEPRYWTSHRYGEAVLAAMNSALDVLVRRYGGDGARFGLVGYSGGAVIAALLAARRDDVDWLVTVAGNLDHRAWTAFHEVTPLTGSLEPYDALWRLRMVPQVHLSGGADDIVPPRVVASFRDRMHHARAARFEEIAGFDHRCCWADDWPGVACTGLRAVGLSVASWCP